MAGSDAVVAAAGAPLQSYLLGGHAASSVVSVSPSFQAGSMSNGNGTTSLRFTRNVTFPGRVPINTNGSTFIIWATSADRMAPFPGPANHGPNQGAISIDFAAASSGPPISATNLPPKSFYDAHSWMMWVAFGVLFPLGVLTARYGKRWDPFWFYAHLGIQILAICIATGAGAISLARFSVGSLLHSQVGLAVLILIWIQPVLGLIRPHKGTLARAPWFLLHWLIGMTAVILGWVNIYWGLDRYRLRFGGNLRVWYVLWSIILSVWAFLYLFLADWPNFERQTDRTGGKSRGIGGSSFKGEVSEMNGEKSPRDQNFDGNMESPGHLDTTPDFRSEKV